MVRPAQRKVLLRQRRKQIPDLDPSFQPRLDFFRCCCFNLSNNYFCDILQMCTLLLSISSLPLSCSDPPLHQKLDFQREIRRHGSLILPLLPFCLQIGFSDETLSFFFSLQCTNLIFQPSAFSMKWRQKHRLIWPESSRTSNRYYLSFRSVEISVRLDWWNHCACNCDKWGKRRGRHLDPHWI